MNDENMNQEGAPMPEGSERKSVGPAIGIIIIILIVVLGGFYFWSQRPSGPGVIDDPVADELRDVSESDEIEDIEADLDADFEDLDAELDDLEAELESDLGL